MPDTSNLSSSLGIYLHGDDLDPAVVSKITQTIPTKSWMKGDQIISPTSGIKSIKRSGFWSVKRNGFPIAKLEGELFALLEPFSNCLPLQKNLPDIADAVVAIFFATDQGETPIRFNLNADAIAKVNEVGARLTFEVSQS